MMAQAAGPDKVDGSAIQFGDKVPGMNQWKNERRELWKQKKEHAYYYRYVWPGLEQGKGQWLKEEHDTLMKALKDHDNDTTKVTWSELAKAVGTRVGYQVRSYFHNCWKNETIDRDSYIFDPDVLLRNNQPRVPDKAKRTPKPRVEACVSIPKAGEGSKKGKANPGKKRPAKPPAAPKPVKKAKVPVAADNASESEEEKAEAPVPKVGGFAKLHLENGGECPREHLVSDLEILVGNSRDSVEGMPRGCEFFDMNSPSAPAQLCRISWKRKQREWVVRALATTGFEVDGRWVLPVDGDVQIKSQSKICLGSETLYFLLPR